MNSFLKLVQWLIFFKEKLCKRCLNIVWLQVGERDGIHQRQNVSFHLFGLYFGFCRDVGKMSVRFLWVVLYQLIRWMQKAWRLCIWRLHTCILCTSSIYNLMLMWVRGWIYGMKNKKKGCVDWRILQWWWKNKIGRHRFLQENFGLINMSRLF